MSIPKRIVVTIDRLVLKGVNARDTASVSAALQQGLNQALLTRGISASHSMALSSLPAQTIKAGDSGRELGVAAGQAVHRAISQGLNRGKS